MTTQLDMIRGRSNVVTLTNNSGGGLVAGDVCVQDTSADEKVTTTTGAASVLKVFIAAETIASGAAGKFYESGYCPLVNVNASVTRGRFLFTHTVAKQAAENATYGPGAFGKILKSGTTPSAIIYSATAQVAGSGTIGGSSGSTDNAVIRADGTGGSTLQSSAATIDDSGTVNIPTGQTYNINGSPHTHAGGGGITTYTDVYGSPPGSPAAGDMWYPSDGLLYFRYSGSAWVPVGPYQPALYTKPVIGDFSWTNQGSCTATDYGGLELYHPAESGLHTRIFAKNVPGTTYTIDVVLRLGTFQTNYHSLGLCWTDGTKAIIIGSENINANFIMYKFANLSTGDSGSYITPANWNNKMNTGHMWIRLQEDPTNRTVSWSMDGRRFFQVHQVGRTDFLTATQVGFAFHSEEATQPDVMHVLSWAQS